MKWKRQGKTKVFTEKSVQVQLCLTTNHTWTGVGYTAGLRDEKCSSSDDNPLFTNWINITKPKNTQMQNENMKINTKKKRTEKNSINKTKV